VVALVAYILPDKCTFALFLLKCAHAQVQDQRMQGQGSREASLRQVLHARAPHRRSQPNTQGWPPARDVAKDISGMEPAHASDLLGRGEAAQSQPNARARYGLDALSGDAERVRMHGVCSGLRDNQLL